MPEKLSTISIAAKRAGIGIETIRYYQRIGLIDEPEKPASGYRVYSENVIERLRFIKRAKDLGFSLAEIATLLILGDDDSHCEKAKALAAQKLNIIRDKLNDLQSIESTLEALIQCCEDKQPRKGCPIINAITRTGNNKISPCKDELSPMMARPL